MARAALLVVPAVLLVGAPSADGQTARPTLDQILRGAPSTTGDLAERQNLDPLFAFDDPAHCVPSAGFRQVIDGLIVRKGEGWTYGELVLPSGYELPAQSLGMSDMTMMAGKYKNGSYRAVARVHGKWNGLNVAYLSLKIGARGKGRWVGLHFFEEREKVDAVRARMGFPAESSDDGNILTCRFQ